MDNTPALSHEASTSAATGPNWRSVALFLGLTFLLTYGLNLALYLAGGLFNMGAALVLQLQMLLPAFSAMVLILFAFREHPMHLSRRQEPGYSKWGLVFYIAFIIFTLAMTLVGILGLLRPEQMTVLSSVSLIANLIMIMVLISLRMVAGRASFAYAGLAGGTIGQWVLYTVALVAFYTLGTALNAAFQLGEAVDLRALLGSLGVPMEVPTAGLYAMMAIQTILVGSAIGIVMGFGEEFGWRGYLQSELVRMGKVRGILLLGVIWGVWHTPVILMGHNYPGTPVLGSILMVGYTIALGFIFGYAMLKTGAIWLVAFLHAVNNQTLAYLSGLVYTPASQVYSFGVGIYGLVLLAVVVLLILRDPVWKE